MSTQINKTMSEEEKSPREVAQLFLDKWHIYANPLDAVELLIKGRDERAAKIADERAAFNARLRDGYKADHNYKFADLKDTRRDEAEMIASAIRGKS